MKLRINGKEEQLEGDWTVERWLRSKGIEPRTVAVEINMNVLEKSKYGETPLSDGDVVEVVRFVGGGA